MKYTVQQLATLAGVSTRTLHHYDEIGLLKPVRHQQNGYRQYGEAELLKLQQIMFFRELEFPLKEIIKIIEDPGFDLPISLLNQRRVILMKKERMEELLETIDRTIKKVTKKIPMNDDELYDGFSKEELAAYTKEAEERWGHTTAYKQSVERYGKLSTAEKKQLQKDGDDLMTEIATAIDKGLKPRSLAVQELVERHYQALNAFYDPNLEMYRNMSDMFAGYTGDERYMTYFKKFHPELPEFMRTAIHFYCDQRQ